MVRCALSWSRRIACSRGNPLGPRLRLACDRAPLIEFHHHSLKASTIVWGGSQTRVCDTGPQFTPFSRFRCGSQRYSAICTSWRECDARDLRLRPHQPPRGLWTFTFLILWGSDSLSAGRPSGFPYMGWERRPITPPSLRPGRSQLYRSQQMYTTA